MEELCREVDEAVQLIMRDGNEAIYVEKIEGTQTVRLYTAIGRRSPIRGSVRQKHSVLSSP